MNSNSEDLPNPLGDASHLPAQAEEEPQSTKGGIWVATELEILRDLLVQYKGLSRKEKRPFLRQKAIPAIKNSWGPTYKFMDKDKEKKLEWRMKKTVCV